MTPLTITPEVRRAFTEACISRNQWAASVNDPMRSIEDDERAEAAYERDLAALVVLIAKDTTARNASEYVRPHERGMFIGPRTGGTMTPPKEVTLSRGASGPTIHDNGIHDAGGCPRGRTECVSIARYASPGYESFMCCGQTSAAPVPTDRLRLCIKSTHKTGVDILVNLDERDAVHTSSVLLAGLSALGSVSINASDRASLTEDNR